MCHLTPAFLTRLLEHDHGLWRGVNRQGPGPLHGAVGPAGHAVASSRVGKPQTLRRILHLELIYWNTQTAHLFFCCGSTCQSNILEV